MDSAFKGSIINKTGGYSWIVKFIKNDTIIGDSVKKHSFLNNLELSALLSLLNYLINNNYISLDINIYTDNEYLYNTLSKGWLDKWATNDWKKSNGETIKSKDLWSKIYYILQSFVKKPLFVFTKNNQLLKECFKNATEINL